MKRLRDYIQDVLAEAPATDIEFDLLIDVDKEGQVWVVRASGAASASRIRFTVRARTNDVSRDAKR